MKTTPFFYFSGERAFILEFIELGREIPLPILAKLYKELEVIVDSRLNIVAMRFDLTKGPGKIIKTVDNNWALTKMGEYLSMHEQQELIAFCKDLKENAENRSINLSGSEAGKIQESLYKKMCRDIDCFRVLLEGKFLID
jgi:hypothetical protein